MGEIAKCPVCGKDPEVWCRDDEIRIRIVCCKHAAYSTPGWNQHAAAMAYATAEEWFMQTEDYSCAASRNEAGFKEWDSINFEAEEALNAAQQRVLEVFGEAKG